MSNTIGLKSKVTLSLVGLLYITGCSNSGSSVSGGDNQANQVIQMSQFNVNKYPLNKLVCDPFGNNGNGSNEIRHGVKAELYYRSAGQPRYYSVVDYLTKTTKSEQSLFFTDINVPSRSFQEGFATKTSAVVKNDAGEKLIEYFALKMKTDLALKEDQEEGLYELAVISDDGTIVKANIGGVEKNLILNDGDHPTKMGCSTQVVELKRGQRLPLEIQYYQGPRYHIANVLLMRKSTTAGEDSLCGVSGINEFFHDTTGVPRENYNNLLARGWRVVEPENYLVPIAAQDNSSDDDYNPCVEGSAPVISDLKVEVGIISAKVSWKTDIPSTSQVLVTNVLTGEVVLTLSDNQLRLDHGQELTGLSPNTEYKAKAISISEDLGKEISQEIVFKTKILAQ